MRCSRDCHFWASLSPDDLLGLRIPRERAAQPHGDVRQVARRDRAVVRVDVGDRLFARLDALGEVPHVMAGLLPLVELRDQARGQRIGLQLVDRLAVERFAAAADVERALGPLEHHAVAARRMIDDQDLGVVGKEAANGEFRSAVLYSSSTVG